MRINAIRKEKSKKKNNEGGEAKQVWPKKTLTTDLLVSTCSSFSLQKSELIHLHRIATKKHLLTPRARLLATIWDLCLRPLLDLVAESHLCRRSI